MKIYKKCCLGKKWMQLVNPCQTVVLCKNMFKVSSLEIFLLTSAEISWKWDKRIENFAATASFFVNGTIYVKLGSGSLWLE